MTYEQTLDFLYEQLPMYQRVGAAAFKKDLTNTRALLTALGEPQRKFRAIHIAGTNGKGSVSHLLAAAFQAAGWRTGLYTSPHYQDFRERIKVDGQLAERDFVIDFVARIRPLLPAIQPSFFEITVAMAFDYFARQQVDMAIVEVGLGGRLDSTNVITPELSVITNISFDHQQFLGDTLPLIAGEKAGIIKSGVPVVIGETQAETRPVFLAKAADCAAPVYFADQHIRASVCGSDTRHTRYRIERDAQELFAELAVNLHGPYQTLNVQTALAALWQWEAHHGQQLFSEEVIRRAWSQLRQLTRFQGRWQVLHERPLVLADSAHNEGGLRPVLTALLELCRGHLHIILGMVNDKDLRQVLPLFPATATYYFAKADIPRGLPAADLQAAAAEYGLRGQVYPSIPAAYRAAVAAAQPDDVVFVGGSIFTVAEVLPPQG